MKSDDRERQSAEKGKVLSDSTTANSAEQAFDRSGRGLREQHPDRDKQRHQESRRLEPK